MGKLIYFIVVGSLLNQLMIYWGKFICEFKKNIGGNVPEAQYFR